MNVYTIQRMDIHQAVIHADSEEEALALADDPSYWELLTVSDNEIVDEYEE